jgi:predicted methyltransferase
MQNANLVVLLVLGLLSPGPLFAQNESEILAAVADDERPGEDREGDAERKPAEVLAFARVGPGIQVADLMAGSGWYIEVLSHLVGKRGMSMARTTLCRMADTAFGWECASKAGRSSRK